MRAVVTVMPIAGHVAPVTGIVAELLRRGHQVRVYTGSRYVDRFAALGAEVLPWSAARDFDEADLAAASAGPLGPVRGVAKVAEVFLRTGAGQVRDLDAELDRQPADLLVADVLSIGAGLTGELRGVPWASLNLLPFNLPTADQPPPGFAVAPARGRAGRVRNRLLWATYRGLTAGLQRSYNQARSAVGLPRDPGPYAMAFFSPWLVVATGGPLLEPPGAGRPDRLHFVGRVATAGATDFGRLPDPDPARPRVLVTQGTHNVDPRDLLQPALTGLAGLDLEVIATSGRREVTDLGVRAPDNARVVDFLDFTATLPSTAVMITNGGWGGVLQGLAAGVPLVVAGGDIDKPEIARRVARAGAGINLRTGHPRPAAVAAAVQQILADPGYASRARQVGAELVGLGGAPAAVDLLERLADTRSPVRRG